jgi:hypothetical protein
MSGNMASRSLHELLDGKFEGKNQPPEKSKQCWTRHHHPTTPERTQSTESRTNSIWPKCCQRYEQKNSSQASMHDHLTNMSKSTCNDWLVYRKHFTSPCTFDNHIFSVTTRSALWDFYLVSANLHESWRSVNNTWNASQPWPACPATLSY